MPWRLMAAMMSLAWPLLAMADADSCTAHKSEREDSASRTTMLPCSSDTCALAEQPCWSRLGECFIGFPVQLCTRATPAPACQYMSAQVAYTWCQAPAGCTVAEGLACAGHVLHGGCTHMVPAAAHPACSQRDATPSCWLLVRCHSTSVCSASMRVASHCTRPEQLREHPPCVHREGCRTPH